MKLSVIMLVVVLVAVLGGFAWLSFSDVSVTKTEIRKPIPSERFSNATKNP